MRQAVAQTRLVDALRKITFEGDERRHRHEEEKREVRGRHRRHDGRSMGGGGHGSLSVSWCNNNNDAMTRNNTRL